jgi:uncharacterized membrane protein
MAKDYSFAVVVYDGPASAQAVLNILKDLQEEETLDIKEAAVFSRYGNTKISMSNEGFVGTGKGGVLGLVIGAVVVSAPLAGLVLGGLIGFGRSGDRRHLKQVLDEALDADQSALAIVIKQADWAAVAEATKSYPGEIIMSELSDEALATLEDLADAEEFKAATAEAIEST